MSESETETALNTIKSAVGPKGWAEAAEAVEPYVTETRGKWRGTCDLVVRPASTEEVAAVVTICAEAAIPIVPQGGNTGLVGGGVPQGGIVLSLDRLTTVRHLDPIDLTMTVDAGCILADIQAAAAEVDCLFPLSLAAEGSCRIGGNIATNAGGVHVLRYGNTRDLILGLEAVLPDGRVWDGLRRLRKDNTGYDLKQLFIGSEGTLGVITGAVLKLYPKPRRQEVAFVGGASAEAMLALLQRVATATGSALTAFEYINENSLDLVLEHIPGSTNPLATPYPAYALVEVSSATDDEGLRESLEAVLATALEDEIIVDAVVAQNAAQSLAIWNLRENLPEAQRHAGGSIKHDVSVPVSKTAEFLRRAGIAVLSEMPDIRISAFGHMGDGNIHYNLSQPLGMDTDEYLARWDHFNGIVHEIVMDMNGSFSAEHGIGQLKTGDMAHYKGAVELDLMRTVKQALDPKGIMNPGKVVPGR